jgi:hypothetical protein
MATDLESMIPITVEYAPSLDAMLEKAQEIEDRLTPKLRALLQRLGLAGEPAIEFRIAPSSRAVRIRVHGELQPYSPDLMKRVWRALAPVGLRDLPETMGETTQSGFPDEWLRGYLTGLDLSDHVPSINLAPEYLAQLVYEIVQERPACLVGPAQISAYLEDGSAHQSYPVPPDFGEELSTILKSLLDLGVSVEDKALVLQISGGGREHGRLIEDTTEGIFAQLRPDRIEIHVNPNYLQSIAPGTEIQTPLSVYAKQLDPSLQDLFRSVEQTLFYELGIQLPDLVWVPSPEVGEGMIAVKINERLAPPALGLKPGELLVDARVEALAEVEIQGWPTINPATGKAHSTIVSDVDAGRVSLAGYTAWTPPILLALVLSQEIRRLAYRLLDIEYVEYRLALLQHVFPDLVRAATGRYSVEDITQVLRGFLREGLSIRDMGTILERLLQYDTISIYTSGYLIFDDRLPLREGTPPESAHSWPNYHEFVRRGLKYQIRSRYAQSFTTLYAYILDQDLAGFLVALAADGQPTEPRAELTEAEREALLDAVWNKVGNLVTTTAGPVILTASSLRVALRKLIALELPDLPVIAYAELPPELYVETIDTIG